MSEVQHQHLVQMSVSGKEVPVSLSSFQSLAIVENISTKLPAIEFAYSDASNALVDNLLVDDVKMGFVLHSANYNDPEQPLEFIFRAKGAKYVPVGNRTLVTCSGIFDRMEYLRKIQKMPVEGNSSDSAKKIAQQNGFGKFDIDSTNDKQWWRPKGQMQFVESFVRHLVTHGRADEKSVLSLGVSDDGTFHFKNVAKLAEKKGGRRITEVERVNRDNGDIPLLAWQIKSLGGLINTMSGYGSNVVQEKLTGVADIISKVNIPILGGALNMSSAVQGAVQEVVKIYAPTDLGNTHKKFYEAKEQNVRGLQQLQSCSVEFMTNMATGLKIYDVVDFQPHLTTNNELFSAIAGSYIISSKTRYFNKSIYREKFTLVRSGFGAQKGQVGFQS